MGLDARMATLIIDRPASRRRRCWSTYGPHHEILNSPAGMAKASPPAIIALMPITTPLSVSQGAAGVPGGEPHVGLNPAETTARPARRRVHDAHDDRPRKPEGMPHGQN